MIPLDILTIQVPEWMDSAPCASTDPALFFPDKGEGAGLARSICATCPTRIPCLEYALAHEATGLNHRHGIYGGLNPTERHRLARTRRAA